ncbi:MAG: NAD-dependent epimerase/dehydratase family protein [Vicinamibacterales bacterium]
MSASSMNVLVLGGTRFIGRHIVEALLASGHRVSVLTRGRSPDPLDASVERLHGDRSEGASGLAALAGRRWDACIDVSGYTPLQVRSSAEALADHVRRYVFVSTVSVYAQGSHRPVVETDPLLPEAGEAIVEVTNENYGPLKVTCERIVREVFGAGATFLRPQIVAGPFDPTGRHTYWVQRSLHGGETAAPGTGNEHVQVVDARDIAQFTRRVVEQDRDGTFNMAGPRMTWTTFLQLLGVTSPVWIPPAIIQSRNVSFTEMPLYVEDASPFGSIMHVDASHALAAGFKPSTPERTIHDTREWLRANPFKPALTPERERDLIAAARG